MGGNVFKGKTDSIKLEHITPTLDAYFTELKCLFPKKVSIFNINHFKPLGSAGKKSLSGDIDLGIDTESLLDDTMSDKSISEWGIDPITVRNEYFKLEKRARTSSPEMLLMKAFLKELTLYINKNAPTLYCDDSKVTPGNIFSLYPQINEQGKDVGIGVQIDWMVGSMKWLTFSYYSDAYPESSNVSGLHATQALLALFQVANMSFNHTSGVKDKETNMVIATDPDTALNVLSKALGAKITLEDRNNFYMMYNVISTLPKAQYDQWINTYLKILDSTRTDIPDILHSEWKSRKEELNLQGKFLPNNSLLKCEINA